MLIIHQSLDWTAVTWLHLVPNTECIWHGIDFSFPTINIENELEDFTKNKKKKSKERNGSFRCLNIGSTVKGLITRSTQCSAFSA